MHHIALIPGDGIGPDVTNAAVKVLEATGVQVEWHIALVGQAAVQQGKSPLPAESIALIEECGVALKGPLIVEKGAGRLIISREGATRLYPTVNNAIRRELGAFVNLRPIRNLPGVYSRYQDVDIVIVREVTEDVYSGHEHRVGADAAAAIKIITRRASERVARFAFEYARNHGRTRVTAVHKANVLGLTDGLFLESARRVATDYPTVLFDDLMVDNMCYQLVRDPAPFDVLLTPNQYGDIISDLCAGLVGSLGLAPGANIGDERAVFEPVHGAAPDIAGRDIANPLAAILSGAMLLEHVQERGAAARVREAVERVLAGGRFLTPDIGGQATTTEMTAAIVKELERID